MSEQQVRITPTTNGPYQVEGTSSITRMGDGSEIDTPSTVQSMVPSEATR